MSRPPTMHTQSPYENRPANNGLIDFNAPELHQALMMQAAAPHMMMHPFQLQQQAITPNQILAQQACANGLVPVPNGLMQQANGLMPMQQANPMMMQPTMLMTPSQLMAQGQYTMVAQPSVEAHVVPDLPDSVEYKGQKYFARKTEFTEEDVKRRAKDQTRSLVSQKSRTNSNSNKDTRSELVELNNRMQRFVFVMTMLLPKLARVALRHSDVFLLGTWAVLCFPSLILCIIMEKITPLVAITYTLGAWLALAITECYACDLDADTLRRDLKTINLSYHADSKEERQFNVESVMDYYRATTNRDYRILEWFVGPGMHTKLLSTFKLKQEVMVYWRLFNAKEGWNVLELGCGKGFTSNWLAKQLEQHTFWGVDLVKEQVEIAQDKGVAHFFQGDMSRLHECWPAGEDIAHPFDAIFAIESACYMDTDEKMNGLAKSCGELLKTGGTVTIIDGFRSNDFDEADPDQQMAMRMAEAGFRIRKMPSQSEWCAVMAQHGLVLKDSQDLTYYALPFWIRGWRVARFILKFPWLVCWYGNSSPERLETAANLLSVATVAHAMRGCGAANYALLEFVKA